MNKEKILELLQASHSPYELVEHPHANTIEEIDSFHLPHAGYIVKNLFIRDDKKRHYYLFVVQKDKTVNLKETRVAIQSRPLSFASENGLMKYLALPKGSVTPLGILNDAERKVEVYLDEDVMSAPFIGIHPNDNTATIFIRPEDLQSLIVKHGNACTLLPL